MKWDGENQRAEGGEPRTTGPLITGPREYGTKGRRPVRNAECGGLHLHGGLFLRTEMAAQVGQQAKAACG